MWSGTFSKKKSFLTPVGRALLPFHGVVNLMRWAAAERLQLRTKSQQNRGARRAEDLQAVHQQETDVDASAGEGKGLVVVAQGTGLLEDLMVGPVVSLRHVTQQLHAEGSHGSEIGDRVRPLKPQHLPSIIRTRRHRHQRVGKGPESPELVHVFHMIFQTPPHVLVQEQLKVLLRFCHLIFRNLSLVAAASKGISIQETKQTSFNIDT